MTLPKSAIDQLKSELQVNSSTDAPEWQVKIDDVFRHLEKLLINEVDQLKGDKRTDAIRNLIELSHRVLRKRQTDVRKEYNGPGSSKTAGYIEGYLTATTERSSIDFERGVVRGERQGRAFGLMLGYRWFYELNIRGFSQEDHQQGLPSYTEEFRLFASIIRGKFPDG